MQSINENTQNIAQNTAKIISNTTEINKIKDGKGFTDKGKEVIRDLAKGSMKVIAGLNTTVTEGVAESKDGDVKTYAVNVEGTGKVAAGDKSLISGDTLYREVHVKDGNYIKENNTVGQNLSALDAGLKTTSALIENDISRAAAGSNALAALHPMQEFDPDDKAQFALGYGHYRNSNAGAVGAFYQPDENSMVNFGVSFGNGDAGINAGVTFKFGPGGSGHHALTKTQMAKVIDAQSKEIDELKKDNADKDKRIDALEQKMTEILAKLDKSKD